MSRIKEDPTTVIIFLVVVGLSTGASHARWFLLAAFLFGVGVFLFRRSKRRKAMAALKAWRLIRIDSESGEIIAIGKILDAETSKLPDKNTLALIGAIRVNSMTQDFVKNYADDSRVIRYQETRYLPTRLFLDTSETTQLAELTEPSLQEFVETMIDPELGGMISSSSVVLTETPESIREFNQMWSRIRNVTM